MNKLNSEQSQNARDLLIQIDDQAKQLQQDAERLAQAVADAEAARRVAEQHKSKDSE